MQAVKRSFGVPGRWSSVRTATLALNFCPFFYSAKQRNTDYLLPGESTKLFLLQIEMPVMQNLSPATSPICTGAAHLEPIKVEPLA